MSNKDELDDMRLTIINDFSQAWSLNDAAHRVEHFRMVELTGYHINETLRLGFNPKHILLVAYFHDLFSWSRHNHHLMSGEWIMTTDYPLIAQLDPEERSLVASGCREHRASNQQPFTNQFAELMSSADRGFPEKNLKGMLQRAIEYRLHRGDNHEDARKGALTHVKEKFGSQGYARYPNLYMQAFKEELQEQRDLVDLL